MKIKRDGTFSTKEAAQRADVSRGTLARWIKLGLIEPSIGVEMKGKVLWRWAAADIRRAREIRGTLPPWFPNHGRWHKRKND